MHIHDSLQLDILRAPRAHVTTQEHSSTQRAPNYKQMTLPQLRSFCEVARCGSMKAAADKMDVAQPTVWKQIHALEKSAGRQLIDTGREGTTLTHDGRTLLRLASPLVSDFETLIDQFHKEIEVSVSDLVIATSPRVFAEDIPALIPQFAKSHPRVRLRFLEHPDGKIVQSVEAGAADVGLSDINQATVPEELDFQHVYDIEVFLVVPRKHPLASRRRINVRDLGQYPLLNARDSFPSDEVNAALHHVSAYDHPDRRLELAYAQTIVRYAELGLGIGLIGHRAGKPCPSSRRVVEFSMANHFKHLPVHAVYRARRNTDPNVLAFIDLLSSL